MIPLLLLLANYTPIEQPVQFSGENYNYLVGEVPTIDDWPDTGDAFMSDGSVFVLLLDGESVFLLADSSFITVDQAERKMNKQDETMKLCNADHLIGSIVGVSYELETVREIEHVLRVQDMELRREIDDLTMEIRELKAEIARLKLELGARE